MKSLYITAITLAQSSFWWIWWGGWGWGPRFLVPLLPFLILPLGVLLGLWALSSNRLGNFNIRPVPRAGGTLVQQGPYRWIRHPMYASQALWSLAQLLLLRGQSRLQRAPERAGGFEVGVVNTGETNGLTFKVAKEDGSDRLATDPGDFPDRTWVHLAATFDPAGGFGRPATIAR